MNTSLTYREYHNMMPETRLIIRKIDTWESVETSHFGQSIILLFDGNRIKKKPVIKLPSGHSYFIMYGKTFHLENYAEYSSKGIPEWFKKWYDGDRARPTMILSNQEKWLIKQLESRKNNFLTSLGIL